MTHEELMLEALALAREALEDGEVPVGCVIERGGEIIGRGRNRREKGMSALAHAEVEAIHEACTRLGTWRLNDCTMYVTLEPCPMCAGAILNARLSELYYGAKEPITGSCGSVINLFMENYGFSPKIKSGLMKDEAAELMQSFFKKIRESRA